MTERLRDREAAGAAAEERREELGEFFNVDAILDAIEAELPVVPDAILKAGGAVIARVMNEYRDKPAPPAGLQLSREECEVGARWMEANNHSDPLGEEVVIASIASKLRAYLERPDDR
jgi:hypothetical protein